MTPAIKTDDAVEQWVVYDHPEDHPQHFVARRFEVMPRFLEATPDLLIAKTLKQLHRMLPRGLVKARRDPSDDPGIVEVWL